MLSRRLLACLALLGLPMLLTGALVRDPEPGPDTRYWSPDEVLTKLAQWEAQYPSIFHREVIGHTSEFGEEIWAVKISDNAATREPEARVLIAAAIHGNESNGVGAIMVMIDRLLTRYGSVSYYTQMVNGLEMWFVPVLNMDSYRYVFQGGDHWDWWRKTMRDNNGDEQYTYGVDGVDGNRNWDYMWAQYDSTQWESSRYKGPYPFSEGCVVAFRDLVVRELPVIVQSLHSPDVPTIGNKNWWPWMDPITYQYGPDDDIYRPISQTLGSRTQTETTGTYVNGNGACYNNTPKEQCWIYANTGICAFLMEISRQYWWTGATVDTIATRFGRGNFYLMERALQGPGLTGVVTAAHTGLPIEAEVKVTQVHSPSIGPRLTEPVHGKFWRMLLPGSYTVTASAEDFYAQTQSIYVGASGWTQLNFQLQPDPAGVEQEDPRAGAMLWCDRPLRAGGRIHFRMEAAGTATLDLLDVTGRRVQRLFSGALPAGEHGVALQAQLAAGTYFARLHTGGVPQGLKVLVVD